MSATAESVAAKAPVDTVTLTPGVPLTLMVKVGEITYSWVISLAASADGKQMVFTASSAIVTSSSNQPVTNSSGQPIPST